MYGRPLICVLGKGPDLVMLHGWGMHKGIWGDFANRLAARFRLHLVDLPGHGEASRLDCSFSTSEFAKAVADHTPPAAWLGWSLGGQVAIRAALDRQEKVSQLVLLCTNPSFVTTNGWQFAQNLRVFEEFSNELEQDLPQTLDRFMRLQVTGSVNARQSLRQMQAAQLELPAIEALRSGLNILGSENLAGLLKDIRTPCQVIGGSEDRLVPIKAVRLSAELILGAEFHEFEGAGHVPFISHGEELAQLITEFIARKRAA